MAHVAAPVSCQDCPNVDLIETTTEVAFRASYSAVTCSDFLLSLSEHKSSRFHYNILICMYQYSLFLINHPLPLLFFTLLFISVLVSCLCLCPPFSPTAMRACVCVCAYIHTYTVHTRESMVFVFLKLAVVNKVSVDLDVRVSLWYVDLLSYGIYQEYYGNSKAHMFGF